jgi:hypothetical protein
MILDLAPSNPIDASIRFPIGPGHKLTALRIDGREAPHSNEPTVNLHSVHSPVRIELDFQ